jgi:hypothetical protein
MTKPDREVTAALLAIPPPNAAQTHPPEFLRLPPPGQKCEWTGMSRSALNALILPCPANQNRPSVRSFVLRQRGAKTGIRLVDYSSLRAHILAHIETTETVEGAQ